MKDHIDYKESTKIAIGGTVLCTLFIRCSLCDSGFIR